MDVEGGRTEKKKLMIDISFLYDQYSFRGIGIYGRNVISRIIDLNCEEAAFELHLVGYKTRDTNLIELGFTQFFIEENASKINFHSLGDPESSNTKNIIRWYREYKPIIKKVNPDIYFAPHFERGLPSHPMISSDLQNIKTFVTAHDIIPLVTNKFSSKNSLVNFLKGQFYKFQWRGVQNAHKVFTDSNFSKEDIIKFGGVSESKVSTVYLGVDKEFFLENINDEGDEKTLEYYEVETKKYFFYDSGVETNKGSEELLKIISKIKEARSEEIKLVVVGGDFYQGNARTARPKTLLGEKFMNLVEKYNLQTNLVTTGRISDLHLKTLLKNSFAYINLSNYEGFSLGPVQAMAAKIPAVVANASCTPEITAGGAHLVEVSNIIDDTKTDSEIKKITSFLYENSNLEEFLNKSQEIAKRYDWDNTVAEVIKEFQK